MNMPLEVLIRSAVRSCGSDTFVAESKLLISSVGGFLWRLLHPGIDMGEEDDLGGEDVDLDDRNGGMVTDAEDRGGRRGHRRAVNTKGAKNRYSMSAWAEGLNQDLKA